MPRRTDAELALDFLSGAIIPLRAYLNAADHKDTFGVMIGVTLVEEAIHVLQRRVERTERQRAAREASEGGEARAALPVEGEAPLF